MAAWPVFLVAAVTLIVRLAPVPPSTMVALGSTAHLNGALWYHDGVAMTLRLDPQLEAELRLAAEEDRRSVQQTVVLAVETFLALRETAEVRADPEALRALAEARQAVQEGDVVYGTDAVRALLRDRRAS